MGIKKKFIEKIKTEEGFKARVYKDTLGLLTWGFGHNLKVPIPPHVFEIIINESKYKGINALLEWDLEQSITELEKNIPWWKHRPDSCQIVLVDMCFNLGIKGLMSFEKMLLFLKKKDYARASIELINSKYATQVKARAYRNRKLLESCV